MHDKDLKKKSDRQEIISDAFAIRKSKTFLSDTIDGLIEEQKKKIEPITNVIAQLKDSKKKSDKTLKLLAEETRACVTDWETEQKRIADEEAERVAAEELAVKVEDAHEIGLLLAEKFDRELLEALAEEMRIEKAHVARIAKEAAEGARIEAEAKAEREKRELVEREAIAKEQAEQAKRNLIAAEERAKVQAEQAETARFDAERQAVINAKNAAKQAKAAEIERQEAEKAASEKAEAERLANREHVSKIRREAKEALMYWGLTEETAKKIVMAINDGKIPHVKITY